MAAKLDATTRSSVQPSAGLSSRGGASFGRETEGRLADRELRIERKRIQAKVRASPLSEWLEKFFSNRELVIA